MDKNTSDPLGGQYKNASKVPHAGLCLLEGEEEKKIAVLKKAIQEGEHSGIVEDFNPQKHLEMLKAAKQKKMQE